MSEKLTPLSRAGCDFCGRAAVAQCNPCRMLVCYPHSEDHVCSAPTRPTQSLENDATAGAAVSYDATNRSAHEQVAFALWDAVTGNEDEDVPAYAAAIAAAEERGRRRGYGECRDDAAAVVDAAFQAGKWEGLYSKIQSLAPRDSGKEG